MLPIFRQLSMSIAVIGGLLALGVGLIIFLIVYLNVKNRQSGNVQINQLQIDTEQDEQEQYYMKSSVLPYLDLQEDTDIYMCAGWKDGTENVYESDTIADGLDTMTIMEIQGMRD